LYFLPYRCNRSTLNSRNKHPRTCSCIKQNERKIWTFVRNGGGNHAEATFNKDLSSIKEQLSRAFGQNILQTVCYGSYAYFRFETEEAAQKAVDVGKKIKINRISYPIKHALKDPQRGCEESIEVEVRSIKKSVDDANRKATTTTIAGPFAEDLRWIVEESLEGCESSRVEGYIARITLLESDAAHKDEMYEVLLSKHDALKSRVKVREGSEGELQQMLAEQRGTMEGYTKEVRCLEAEKSNMELLHKEERKAFDRERWEMEVALSGAREAHPSKLKRAMDEAAASSSGSYDCLLERYDAVKAELASVHSEIDDADCRHKRLKAENNAACDALMRRVSELERAQADLLSLLEAERRKNEANRDAISLLESNASSHVATITRQEGSISRLEEEVHSNLMALNDSKCEMEGMQSPHLRDALEQEFSKEVRGLKEKLAAMEAERVDLQNQLQERDETYQAVRSELDAIKVEQDELNSRLSDTSGAVEEAKAKAADQELKVQHLSEEVRTAHAKIKANEEMLEEMAKKNEQLLTRLKATDSKMKLHVQEVKDCVEGEVRELASKYATAVAEKDEARDEIANLQACMGKLDKDFATSQQLITSLQTNKLASDCKLTELSSQLLTLTNHLKLTRATVAILEEKLRAKDEYCKQFESIERRLMEEKCMLNEIRANLHNRVIKLSGNICVFVRVRPFVKSERRLTSEVQQNGKFNWLVGASSSRPSSRGSMGPTGGRTPSCKSGEYADDGSCPFHFPSITNCNTRPPSSNTGSVGAKWSTSYTSFNDLTKQVIELTEPHKDHGGLKERRKKWKYGFDRVFSQDHEQDDVWEGAEPLVQSCIDGFHICMFAYGQVFPLHTSLSLFFVSTLHEISLCLSVHSRLDRGRRTQ
jgi:chromosome segregation ATPase